MQSLTNQDRIKFLIEAARQSNLPPYLLLNCYDTTELETSSQAIVLALLEQINIKTTKGYSDYYEVGDFEATIKKERLIEIIRNLQLSALNDQNPKICVIKGLDLLTNSAANALLKILEEDRRGLYWIFLTTHLNGVLDTLKSRGIVINLLANKKSYPPNPLVDNCILLLSNKDDKISFLYNDLVKLDFKDLNLFLEQIILTLKTLDLQKVPNKWILIEATMELQKNIQNKSLNSKILINKWIGSIIS